MCSHKTDVSYLEGKLPVQKLFLAQLSFSFAFLTAHVNLFMSVIASCSLQQENKELKATVAELQSALEAERRRVAALEICLKNAERSRDEAQRRNSELQRDIQQFLMREKAPT